MAKNWYFKFEQRVWQSDPDLSRCSLAARGFWLEMLCVMYEKDEWEVSGTIEQIARVARCEPSEVTRYCLELKKASAADVTIGHGDVTVKSRRLEKLLKVRKGNTLRKQKERCHSDVTLHSNSNSKEIRKEPTETVAETIWDEFTALQVKQGILPNTARARLGKLIKTYGQTAVIQTYAEIKDVLGDKANAYAYFQGAVKNYKPEQGIKRHADGSYTVGSPDDLQRLIEMNLEY